MELDLEELAALVELLSGADFTEFRLQKGDLNLVVRRGGPADESASVSLLPPTRAAGSADQGLGVAPALSRPAATPTTSDQLQPDEVVVAAPMLGTFYRSPKPGEPAFVEVGDKIDADAVVGIVEVMKLMSSVTAGVAGEITGILAQDGQLIEADQPLFVVRVTQ